MRTKGTTLLLAGLAAYAYYKFSKMSREDRDKMVGNLKEKGKKWMNQMRHSDGTTKSVHS
ncbi:hypothetical protein [Flavihumibacter solisilvae]|uniref:Uncharacterized protein n=1 Tax=Flavihumibacter solisilvae TaxID=1349421 RepID=A0A0C1LLR0_9BACT|nr:hypothetical protein [Flavihumibacter solisilvae]KIC96283.1 hypothetical protein OI18_00510 [Flavihumibacter solisilvae]